MGAEVVPLRTLEEQAKRRRRLRLVEPGGFVRPTTRGECAAVPRPCPFVSCRWSLYLDVLPDGALKLNFPDLTPDEMPPGASCALDVAEAGEVRAEDLGDLLNLSREGMRKLYRKALAEVRRAGMESESAAELFAQLAPSSWEAIEHELAVLDGRVQLVFRAFGLGDRDEHPRPVRRSRGRASRRSLRVLPGQLVLPWPTMERVS